MIRIEELKEAGPAELAHIAVLMRELHDDGRAPTLEEMHEILGNKNDVVMVARDDEKIVGIATLYIIQKFGKRSAHIEDVVVGKKYREQGLGRKLMKEVIDVAKKHGVQSIALTSQPKRVAAHKLYESLGFVKRDTNAFRLTL